MTPTQIAQTGHTVIVPRILLVEDSESIRFIVMTVLEESGYQVIPASNGKEGLELLQESPLPDLIIFDLSMPIMGGIDFHRTLVQRPYLQHIPAILFSSEMDALQTAKELKCEGYSTKYFEDLLREVMRILPISACRH